MRKKKLEKLMARLCVLDIVIGLLLFSGVFEGSFQIAPFTMFTVMNAIWAMVYYLLEIRYLKVGGRGVISNAMRFTVLINSTGMALISMIYLRPMHSSLVGPDFIAFILLQYVLPVLMILDYIVGVKNTFRKKQILYAIGFPFVYNLIAVGLGFTSFHFGLNGMKFPYPFMNVEQLGWGIVITNLCLTILLEYLYCRIWIWIDQLGKRNDPRN